MSHKLLIASLESKLIEIDGDREQLFIEIFDRIKRFIVDMDIDITKFVWHDSDRTMLRCFSVDLTDNRDKDLETYINVLKTNRESSGIFSDDKSFIKVIYRDEDAQNNSVDFLIHHNRMCPCSRRTVPEHFRIEFRIFEKGKDAVRV